jgi:hypothetical protein
LSGRVEQDWGALTLTVSQVVPLPPLHALGGAARTPTDRVPASALAGSRPESDLN